MNAKILISALALAFSALALEVADDGGTINQRNAISVEGEQKSDTTQTPDQIEIAYHRIEFLENAQKIRYVKNPCAGMKDYAYNRYRGFGFENGIVKKYHETGVIVKEPKQMASLAKFLLTYGVCYPINKTTPKLDINLSDFEVW